MNESSSFDCFPFQWNKFSKVRIITSMFDILFYQMVKKLASPAKHEWR